MATHGIVVPGGTADAAAAVIAAVREVGGNIATKVPGLRFTINGRDGDSSFKRSIPYTGVAHLAPGSPGQTRVDVVVKAPDVVVVFMVGVTIVNVLVEGLMPTPFPFFNLMLLVAGLGWNAYLTYLFVSKWPTDHLDRVVAALSPLTGRAWGSSENHPPMGSSAAEQLKKLGELRAAGVLTDAEFNATKAELLKRMGAHASA
jgi:hypothetical protein